MRPLVLHFLLRPVYETAFTERRVMLCVIFFLASLPAFVAVGIAGGLTALSDRWFAHAVPMEIPLAALTAVVAPILFARMSVLPPYLLSAGLVFSGAYRAGKHRGGVAGAAAFGAFVYAHCAASVCAWY